MKRTLQLIKLGGVLLTLALISLALPSSAWAEDVYKMVTSTDDLTEGTYLIVNTANKVALGTTGNTNLTNRKGVTVTFNDDGTISGSSLSSTVCVLTLATVDGGWTFYDATNSGYLYSPCNGKNQLCVSATLQSSSKSVATITIATDGDATIKFGTSSTSSSYKNWLRYNSNSNNGNIFACYGSGQSDVQLYKKEEGTTTTCAKPVFSPASGTTFDESLTVTATTSTESANIVYNTDNGETFSNFPADGLTLTETTTIYAKAVDPTSALSESSVVSATYTKVEALDGIKALRDQIKADGVISSSSAKTYTVKLTNAVVTKVGDKMASIEQDGYGIYYYNRTTNPFTAGQTITGTITVTGYVYNGWAEIATVDLSNATTTTGEAPDPTTATIAQILADYDSYESRYVRIEGAVAASAFSSKKATFSQTVGETTSSIEAYDTNGSSLSVTKGNSYNIEGILGYSSTTKRFNILSAADIEDASTSSVTAPTFNPAGGTYTEAQTVTITADDGATICYTTDGTDPTTSPTSEWYEAAITISETTTLKAVAMDNDGNMSAVTSATYTIATITGDGTQENPYTVADVNTLKTLGTTVSDKIWVKGYIAGVFTSGSSTKFTIGSDGTTVTNLALTDEAVPDDATASTYSRSDFVAIKLGSTGKLRTIANLKDNSSLANTQVCVYGSFNSSYISGAGIELDEAADKISGISSISIAAEGYGTYYATCAYEMPQGYTGGKITTASADGTLTIDYSKYTAGTVVPAGTSLLIKADETKDHESGDLGNKTKVSIVNTNSTTAADTDDNLLHGADAVTSGTTAVDATNGGTVRYYILSHSADQTDFGFYWAAMDGAAITYQSPYAFLAIETTSDNAVKGFSLSDSATGINAVSTDENAPATIYDLQGRRVNAATRGLYIVNGKKVLVK